MTVGGPALVILAAGASRRLGTCKALVDLGGRTPLERLLVAGSSDDDAPPLVVAGADAAAIRTALPPGVELVCNARWSEGRTGSVRTARDARPARDLLLAPVDVPLVPRAVFERLREAWLEAGEPADGWLAPAASVAGRRRPGHPVVVGRGLLARLSSVTADTPLRRLRDLATPLWMVEVDSTAVLDDLDTPRDLKDLRARVASGG